MGHAGWLEVVTGPMFAGKTTELVRRLGVHFDRGASIKVIKPAIDTRYESGCVSTHSGLSIPCELRDLDNVGAGDVDVLGIDEAQFFAPIVVDQIQSLVASGTHVVAAGLDLTYQGQPFGIMPQLLALADAVTKLRAYCVLCGHAASRTHRLGASGDVVAVGGSEAYQALCVPCFDGVRRGR